MKKQVTTKNKDRRLPGNTELRHLVAILKSLIEARDALWSLTLFDRIFRRKKIAESLIAYDRALIEMRSALVALCGRVDGASSLQSSRQNLISVEELDVLLGRVKDLR